MVTLVFLLIKFGITLLGLLACHACFKVISRTSGIAMANGDFGKDDAHILINSVLADEWPNIGRHLLGEIKKNPISIGPYLLKLKSGKLRYAPLIKNIQMKTPSAADINQQSHSTGTSKQNSNSDTKTAEPPNRKQPPPLPPPPRFQCTIEYRGYPDIEFVLTGAKKPKPNMSVGSVKNKKTKVGVAVKEFFLRVTRRLVPDVQLGVNSVYLTARVDVSLDMMRKQVSFFFVGRPSVQWDMDFSVTKPITGWDIPIPGINQLDSVVAASLARIDRQRPLCVKF